jgi:predicted amidohydrolase YtcJ
MTHFFRRGAGLAAAALFLLSGCSPPSGVPARTAAGAADTIFTGRFVTLDADNPEASAIAVADGRILAVGAASDLQRYEAATTRRIALPGVVLPGFADAHIHVMALGEQLEMPDLRGLTKAEILNRVKEAVAVTPQGEWIQGRGWDQGFWKPSVFPTAADLDGVAPNHPVMLTRIDGHSAWLNSRGLELAGITRETKAPEGGSILRDTSGRPTGMLVDRAIYLVTKVIPPPTQAQLERRVVAALEQSARWGLTSVHDAGVDLQTIGLYKDLLAAGTLPVRIYVMAQGTGATAEHYFARSPEIGLGEDRLTIRSFKAMLDGALGSRGAQLAAPYADAPEETGLELMTDEAFARLLRTATDKGYQVAVHAIGDRAITRALDVFEQTLGDRPDVRFRVEHVSVLNPADLPRFARLGALASLQPNFVGEYSRWSEDRLGPARVRWVKTTRDLLESKAVVLSGSDYPAADSGSPLGTLYCLVTRKGVRGEPQGGWFPDQRIDVARALQTMTVVPAFAAFQEEHLGTLAPGRWADFTVLSADPHEVAPDDLRDLTVLRTVVGGQIVFDGEKVSMR